MSSLGDLLLGKIPEPPQSPDAGDHETERKYDTNNRERVDIKPSHLIQSPPETSKDASNGQYHTSSQKIFPNRIEKIKIEPIEDDRRSNASSTDDLVQELLDPNDRPRNVWHVVKEGTEQKSHEVGDRYDEHVVDRQSRNEDNEEPDRQHRDEANDVAKQDEDQSGKHREHDRGDDTNDRDDEIKATDKGHGKEIRDDRARHDRHRSRDYDKDKDKDRDRRRRSPDSKHSRSKTKRDKYSDDEDDDRNYKRHRGSRSRRHDRRSRSRSRSRSRDSGSRRRRHRSRSTDSRSPVTKRNSRTILVMQLSPRVVSRDLEEFFEDIGRVKEVRLITDSKTRRHKGIAYIEFESASSATKALSLNGQKFHGAPMLIQSALSEKSRGGDNQHASSSSSHHTSHHSSSHTSSSISHHTSSRSNLLPPNSYRVYMGALHVGLTEEMLRTIVEPFGLVHRIEVIKDRTTGFSRGYAFVTFANAEDGQEAIRNLDGFELAGKSMRVSKSTEKPDR